MSKLTDITAIFQKANDAFGPITANPRDADLQRLNETLVVCTLTVTLNGTTAGCASSVVLPYAVYQMNHVGAFDFIRTRAPTTTWTLNDFRRTTVSPKCEGWSTAG